MAQLDKAPNGMTLGELSQRMMVSNGNVTGLVDRLVDAGPGRAPRRRRTTAARRSSASPPRAARSSAPWRARTRTGSPRSSPSFRADEIDDADAPAGQDQGLRAQGDRQREPRDERRQSGHAAACRPTRPQHVRLDGRRQGRDADARTGRTRRTRSPSRATPRSSTSSAPPPRTRASRPSSSPAPAAISAPAATCSRSSARWSRWTRRTCSTSPA